MSPSTEWPNHWVCDKCGPLFGVGFEIGTVSPEPHNNECQASCRVVAGPMPSKAPKLNVAIHKVNAVDGDVSGPFGLPVDLLTRDFVASIEALRRAEDKPDQVDRVLAIMWSRTDKKPYIDRAMAVIKRIDELKKAGGK